MGLNLRSRENATPLRLKSGAFQLILTGVVVVIRVNWSVFSVSSSTVIGPLLMLITFAVKASVPSALPSAEAWSAERALFQRAKGELATGAGSRYQEMRAQLEEYPLRVDLDFAVKLGRLHHMKPGDAKAFLAHARGTPLANRFLVAYLRHKAQDGHWKSFLGVIDAPPEMPELQCYYYRALLTTGYVDTAFDGASTLWDVGYSQDDACDPLFSAWMAEGGPGDDVIWSRALKAFAAKNGHLIRYIKRFASNELKRDLDELAAVYRRPSRIEGDHHNNRPRHIDILMAGVARLAQLNPKRAYEALLSLGQNPPISAPQAESVALDIARHSLFAERSPAPAAWVTQQIAKSKRDELTVIWLRNAIADGDWLAVQEGLRWLSDDVRSQDRWIYWDAKSREALGVEGSQALFNSLASHRSFHGFLAAEKMGQPYQLREAPISDDDAELTESIWLGAARTQELLALGLREEAKEQWQHTLNQAAFSEQMSLGLAALRREWPDFGVDAAIAARNWDRLDLRFPYAFWDEFQKAAIQTSQDSFALIALARRESGLNPRARSKVGARGLMQLMPTTARNVAKKEGVSYRGTKTLYDPQVNIALGTSYYSGLLHRYDGNRVKALAAYNAGPSRVSRWLGDAQSIDQWVDSLPFSETREYVQAVLTYHVIYRLRAGKSATLLTPAERTAMY